MPAPVLAESTLPKCLRTHEPLRTLPLVPEEPIVMPRAVELRPVARAWNRFGGLLGPLCSLLRLDAACAVAVLCVESGGSGFGADGRLKIRFEVHLCKRLLEAAGATSAEGFAERFRFDSTRPWLGHEFRRAETGGWMRVHATQANEWTALEFARTWDDTAALAATSFGAPQILGRNFVVVGYESPQEMFHAFAGKEQGERNQVLALFDFLRNARADGRVLECLRRRDFVGFARLYNGAGQATEYGQRIEECAAAFELLRV